MRAFVVVGRVAYAPIVLICQVVQSVLQNHVVDDGLTPFGGHASVYV